ncbi:MAG: helix-turn-helix transcriptional regulator [Campylobacterales bacterium]|nr:helix-turn-helix transcriptional regulator [Campylobacterales bacterium]
MAISFNNHVFKGHRTLLGSKYVTYGELELPQRLEIHSFSPNGFDWANNSKSSNQLAFSILYQLTNKEIAIQYAKQFTQEIVSSLNSRDWVMSASDVFTWIEKNCELPLEEKPTTTPKVSVKKAKKTNVVKEVCKELGISQKHLAEILEVPEGTISSWAVKNEIPRLGKKAIEFYIQSHKNQKIIDSYKQFINLLQAS